MRESTISNTRYAIWDSDSSKSREFAEGIASNTRYAVWDNRCLATVQECIRGCIYNCIAILTTIIYRIATLNNNRGQTGTCQESLICNGRHAFIAYLGYAIRNGDRSNTGTSCESIRLNSCYAIRNGDVAGGRSIASTEPLFGIVFIDQIPLYITIYTTCAPW